MINKLSEAVLLEACILSNEVSNYQQIEFEAKNWPDKLCQEFPKLSAQWRLYHASHWVLSSENPSIGVEDDYQGIILVNDEDKRIIIAHRGLQLTSIKNLVSGLLIGTQHYPKIAESAIQFCKIALSLSKENDYVVYHTGFSMGGYLAQITGAFTNHHYGRNNQVICFDAPGATPAIEACNFIDNRSNTITYVTALNVVNTTNPPYGFIRQITEFQGQNLFLKNKIKPHVVDQTFVFNIDLIDHNSAMVVKDLLQITLIYHQKKLFKEYLLEDGTFEYSNVCSWPVSTLSLEKVESRTPTLTPGNQDTQQSYGFVFEMIVEHSKKIRTIAGYEECNVLSYHLPKPEVYYTSNSEVYCQASTHEQKDTQEKSSKIVNNDENPETKYESCVIC